MPAIFQGRLLSEDYGKHLMGVEDLIQKHALIESDISVVGKRVSNVNAQAEKFTLPDGPDGSGAVIFIMKAGLLGGIL